MRDNLFGDLRYDQDEQLWTGSAESPLFSAFGSEPFNEEPDQELRRKGLLPLTVHDPTGKGPSLQQVAAFRQLQKNEAEVFRNACLALFDSYRQYTTSIMSGFWGWIGRKLGVKPIESPEELASAATFTSVEVTTEHLGGVGYLLFNVNCDWEPEHGMMVVYHKDRPVSWTTPDALELETDSYF